MRSQMFWLLVAGLTATSMLGTGLIFHQISVLGARGLTPTQAAAVFLPQTAAVILMSVVVGRLSDRFHVRTVVLISMGLLAVGLVLATIAKPGPSVIAYALAIGGASGSTRAQDGALFPRFFGIAHIGAIRGTVFTALVAGSAIGPLVLGAGFDLFGSYRQVLLASLLLPMSIAVWSLFVSDPSRKVVPSPVSDRA